MTKECFVIMPFSKTETKEEHSEEYWTQLFEFIKCALCKCGYKARRSRATPDNIIEGIVKDLQSSNLVLAVLTDYRHNVLYELGIRHSLRKGTIMIIEEGQKIPSDLQSYGVIFYSDRNRDLERLVNELKDHIQKVERRESGNPVASYLAPPYVDLIYTMNRAEGRLREAITLIDWLCKEGGDEQQLLKSIEHLQKSWGDQEEVCIVECESRHYKIKFHRDCKHIGDKANDVWHIATEYINIDQRKLEQLKNIEPTLPEKIPKCQSLFKEIEDSTKGLRIVHLLGWGSRTTVFAYERITRPDWMIIIEAHWRP